MLHFFALLLTAQAVASFELVIGIPLRNTDRLEKKFWDISDPKSADYLQHLSVKELSQLVGATSDHIQVVEKWLDGLGATDIKVSPLRDTVTAAFPATHPDYQDASLWSVRGIPARPTHPTVFDFVLRRDPLAPLKLKKSMFGGSNTSSSERGFGYDIANQKRAYGIPVDLTATNSQGLQMVWGPGTFGYSPSDLAVHKETQCPLLNLDKVHFDTANHGMPGGDNWGEGQLDTQMITSFGLNVSTLVSNTNTSSSTEEGNGFGEALLDFITELASRPKLPQVLSLSLGSLSAYSCDLLCKEAVKRGHQLQECESFLQQQRQVCMFLSEAQVARINSGFQLLGTRGVSIFGSSGDGGSHFSFEPFTPGLPIAQTLNEISCAFQMPIFPSPSPYITSVGGTQWPFSNPDSQPQAWPGSGGGFSWQFGAPAHQSNTVTKYLSSTKGLPPASSFNSTGSAYPDISAVAVDGTSQSSPTMAGIFSLLMDQRLNKGLKPLGFLAPRLWKVMETFPGEAFQSVDDGNTKTSCDNGFPFAKGGWDPVTGWGRPKWDGIVKHFGSDDQL